MFPKRALIHLAKVIEAFVMHHRFHGGQAFPMRRGLHRLLKCPVSLNGLHRHELLLFIFDDN